LELNGVRLQNAAPLLAKTLGYDSLTIGPSIANEVLLIRAKNVDSDELRTKIAATLNATWEHRPEGWILTQTASQRAHELRIYESARERFFTKLVDRSKANIAALSKPFDEEAASKLIKALTKYREAVTSGKQGQQSGSLHNLESQGPIERFVHRLILRMNPAMFAKMTDDAPVVVYNVAPNSMQSQYPFSIQDIVSQAIQELNTWASVAENLEKNYKGPYVYLGELARASNRVSQESFAHVTVRLGLASQSIFVRVYDTKGKQTFQYNIGLGGSSWLRHLQKQTRTQSPLSGEALEYADLVDNGIDGLQIQDHPISPDLLNKILNPEGFDPLSISATAAYLKAIKSPNIIMILSDGQRLVRKANLDDEQFISMLDLKIKEENNWFTASYGNPLAEKKNFADRVKLGKLIRYVHQSQKPFTLEEEAGLVYSLPWQANQGESFISFFNTINTKVGKVPFESMNMEKNAGLRIYGSLDSQQRTNAIKDGISVSSLSDATRLELWRAVFQRSNFFSALSWDQSRRGMSATQLDEAKKIEDYARIEMFQEPTFVLPKGITNNLILKIDEASEQKLIFGSQPGFTNGSLPQSTTEYARHLYMSSRAKDSGQVQNQFDDQNIRVGTEREIVVKLYVGPGVFYKWSIKQIAVTDPTKYTIKTLPKKYQDEINTGYKEYSNNVLVGGSVGFTLGKNKGGGTVPPPP
jgi:hypothetical protein